MSVLVALAAVSLLVWLYLVLFHGRFWQSDQWLNGNGVEPESWPRVCAVIPARNEADSIVDTVESLLRQDYPGRLDVVVVDDNSDDGTADRLAAAFGSNNARLRVLSGASLPAGWAGKMWAVSQGIHAAEGAAYLLLTDADIHHGPGNLRRLVTNALENKLVLCSLMVKLRTQSMWEKLLIPAFIYFFQKLYPFARVNDPARPEAAAAGGCMLVHASTLDQAGGIARIRDRLIDDCALAALLKPQGRIWLGLTEAAESRRRYDDLNGIWRMVTRTAYVQLRHSPLLLAGTVIGMAILYLIPPLALIVGVLGGETLPAVLGGAAWLLAAWSYLPTLDLYGRPAAWALTLPLAGVLYALMTVDSARRHAAGRGGEWKGRTYENPRRSD